jgi:ubiquitin-protein ligase
MNKRILREFVNLKKINDSEFCVSIDDLGVIKAYILAPVGSIYENTFIKVKITLTDNYPFEPPKVIFEHYNQLGVRMHPNLYDCGRVCLSILGTFRGDPWTSVMTIEYILRSIQCLLDDKPMLHEPGRKNNKEYNNFIRYFSLQVLLIDYLKNETDPILKEFIFKHTKSNYSKICKLTFDSTIVSNVGYTGKSIKVQDDLLKNEIKLLIGI